MFSRIRSILFRYKYMAIGAGTLMASAVIVVILLSLPGGQREVPLTAESTPASGEITPAPDSPAPVTPSPVDAPTPGPAQPGTSVPSSAPNLSAAFTYTICPADVVVNPPLKSGANVAFTPIEQPARPLLEHIKAISAGHLADEAGYGMDYGDSYALAEDGTLYSWGLLIGESSSVTSAYPQKVTGKTGTIKQLEGHFTLTEEGDVYLLNAGKAPFKIESLSGSIAIAQGRESAVFALDHDGNVRYYAKYGGPDGTAVSSQLTKLGKVKSIAANPFLALAVTEDGKLLRFDSYGTPANEPVLIELPKGERVDKMFATMSYIHFAYILTDSGRWYVINNVKQQLERAYVPDNTIQITATQHNTFALKSDGTLWAWGDGGNLLPEGAVVPPEKAMQIKGFTGIKTISAGQSHLLALTKDGHVLSAGSNMYGQLGRKPIYAENLTPIGTWGSGLDALFLVYNKLFAIAKGDVFSLDVNNGSVEPILFGQKAKKAFTGLGHYAILTEDGRLIVADPEDWQPCRMLQGPSPIIDAASTGNGIVLALQDGLTFLAEGNARALEIKSELRMEPKPIGKVAQVFGDPVPFALTDMGELYFRERTQDGVPIMKPVHAGAPIKQWSPLHYVFFDGIGFIGRALDRNSRVYDITLNLKRTSESEGETASVDVRKTSESGIALSGGAVIDAKGRISEQLNSTTIDTRLPNGMKVSASASFYHYPIEGRSYLYHVFASEDGALYWLGDMPFNGPDITPEPVVAPF